MEFPVFSLVVVRQKLWGKIREFNLLFTYSSNVMEQAWLILIGLKFDLEQVKYTKIDRLIKSTEWHM